MLEIFRRARRPLLRTQRPGVDDAVQADPHVLQFLEKLCVVAFVQGIYGVDVGFVEVPASHADAHHGAAGFGQPVAQRSRNAIPVLKDGPRSGNTLLRKAVRKARRSVPQRHEKPVFNAFLFVHEALQKRPAACRLRSAAFGRYGERLFVKGNGRQGNAAGALLHFEVHADSGAEGSRFGLQKNKTVVFFQPGVVHAGDDRPSFKEGAHVVEEADRRADVLRPVLRILRLAGSHPRARHIGEHGNRRFMEGNGLHEGPEFIENGIHEAAVPRPAGLHAAEVHALFFKSRLQGFEVAVFAGNSAEPVRIDDSKRKGALQERPDLLFRRKSQHHAA